MQIKLITISILMLLSIGLSFYLGSVIGHQQDVEERVKMDTAKDVMIYLSLETGSSELAKEKVIVLLQSDLMAYDKYKNKYPGFGSTDETLQFYLEKAKDSLTKAGKMGPVTANEEK